MNTLKIVYRWLLAFCGHLVMGSTAFGQQMDLAKYDVFIHDTLISKADFVENASKLSSDRAQSLVFAPITDGDKVIYYLNGKIYAKGQIKNKLEEGIWTYWYKDGQKAREGRYAGGKREGTHTYWYQNGKLRGVGNFANDKYDGKWTMYKEDGIERVEQVYKKGKIVD